MNPTIKLLISCQVYVFAEGLKLLLDDLDGIKVIGLSCNDNEFLEFLSLEPDIVVSDYYFCDYLFRITDNKSQVKVLLINDHPNISLTYPGLQDMVSRGLAGIVTNNSDSNIIKKAIQALYEGELWIDHKTISQLLCCYDTEKKSVQLTKKEAEILHYLCSGFSNKKIAQELSISEQTVKSHCNHLFKKFGVKNRVKLALNASNSSSRHQNGSALNWSSPP